MPLKSKQLRSLTGVGLALLTLLTRLPFRAATLFEFDSVNFAVALDRYSLEQATPHMPGYIGHILLGRIFRMFTDDPNTAFVSLSIVFSILSVLLIWRAGAQLRGERVGLIAALLWVFTPLFWFYGEVATAYIHEAFFSTLIIYLSLKLLREPRSEWILIAMGVALALAGSMRQNMMLFFFPLIVYVAWKTKQPWVRIGAATAASVAVTFVWFKVLIAKAGGLDTYLYFAGAERVYKDQSILFGNSLHEHLAVVSKMVFYLIVASLPIIAVALYYFIAKKEYRLREGLRQALRSPQIAVLLIAALPALLFYAAVYFMKAGYLLSVLAPIVLAGAIVIDELAIAYAWRRKQLIENRLAHTRPIITRRAIVLSSAVCVFNILWFTLPLPGKQYGQFVDGVTAFSLGEDLSGRVARGSVADRLLSRAFAYTSAQGVSSNDEMNERVMNVLKQHSGAGHAILDTWWWRWGYYYTPEIAIFDNSTAPDHLLVGRSLQVDRVLEKGKTIDLSAYESVLVIMRPDHGDLGILRAQAQLETLDTLLGIYRITPNAGQLSWRDRSFRF
jgi:hypothetical protein